MIRIPWQDGKKIRLGDIGGGEARGGSRFDADSQEKTREQQNQIRGRMWSDGIMDKIGMMGGAMKISYGIAGRKKR